MTNKQKILIVLVVLNIFSWSVVFYYAQDKGLEVCFLDVGQGDAIFIETPQGHQILIDGGPDASVIKKLEERMPFWDRTLDLVILTHPEKDHMFGLIEVFKNYYVKNILWTGAQKDTLLFAEWQKAIEKEGAAVRIGQKDLRISFGPDRYFQVLYPFEGLQGRRIENINDSSLVIKLFSLGENILFTGDISDRIEELLVQEGVDVKTDILKVAHHGSKNSSSGIFLEAAGPEIAVISAGAKNPYGHPSPEVLTKLDNLGIKVLLTSKNKDICLIQKKKKQFYLLNPTE